MTNLDLAELRRLCAEATPGAWQYRNTGCTKESFNVYAVGGEQISGFPHMFEHEKDAAFVAAARTAVPALIAEVERLRSVLRQCEFDEYGRCQVCHNNDLDGHTAYCAVRRALEGKP